MSFLTGNGREKLPFRILNTTRRKKKLPFQVIQMQRVQDPHKMSQLLREIIIVICTQFHLCTKSYMEESYSTTTYSYSMCCVLSLVTQKCSTLCNPMDCSPPWGFSREEYYSRLPCPPPGDLPNPGIKPRCPALQVDSLPSEPLGKPSYSTITLNLKLKY